MKWLLALDLATSTGYALYRGEEVVDSGVIMLGHGDMPMGERLRDLVRGLNGVLVRNEVLDAKLSVVCEHLHLTPRNGQIAMRFLAGISVFTEFWVYQRGAKWVTPVPATTVRKHAANLIGDEKMERKGKRQTMEAARRLLQRAVNSDDEADAVVLGSYVLRTLL